MTPSTTHFNDTPFSFLSKMGLVSMSLFKGLVVFQLSLLLMSLSVNGDFDTSNMKPPPIAYPPVKPPTRSPVAPAPRRHIPLRSFVAVQGVVYCKPCKYAGVNTLWNATLLAGATVKLVCNNTRHPITVNGTTDKNGYFFMQAPKKVTTYGKHKCKVFLVSSPSDSCKKPTNLNWGVTGAALKLQKVTSYFALYRVGPFAFDPTKCPRPID